MTDPTILHDSAIQMNPVLGNLIFPNRPGSLFEVLYPDGFHRIRKLEVEYLRIEV